MTATALLAGVRVLDFGAEPLAYAARIYVELGAEVVLVEPEGGLALRSAPPMVPSGSGADVSATFLAYAGGKLSVTIDEATPDGRALRDRLVRGADVVLVPSDPGEAESRGLDDETLRGLNPAVVVVSATPFGLTGPYRNWVGSDTTAWASSGLTSTMGDPDRPPVVAPRGLSNAVTSLNAAMGGLLALRARRRGSPGQLVDISMQESVSSVSMEAGPLLAVEGRPLGRLERARSPGVGLYEARDGSVDITAFLPAQWDVLAQWIADDLGIEEATHDVFKGSVMVRAPYADVLNPWISDLTARYDKQEFFLEAQRRGLTVGAVNEPADLLDDVQLRESGGWSSQPAPSVPEFRMPRGPLRVDGTVAASGAVPSVGEHNAAILGPLGG